MKMFIEELSKFSKKNWYIYIILAILLIITSYTDSDNFWVVVLVTVIHFIADIFMMMMFSAYAQKEYKKGTLFQITSTSLFLALKIYTGFIDGQWVYLIADPVFILAAIKSYQFDVKEKLVKWINIRTMSILSLILLLLMFWIEHQSEITIISEIKNSILTIGLFLLAISFSIVQNEKLKFRISTVAFIFIVLGAFGKMLYSFTNGDVHGLEISSTVLPLAILVHNLKQQK